jgi:hypothetical protein
LTDRSQPAGAVPDDVDLYNAQPEAAPTVAHCPPELLDDLADLLAGVRTWGVPVGYDDSIR